jgi:hypothetical protein
MRVLAGILVAGLLLTPGIPQQADPVASTVSVVTFAYENAALVPSQYRLTIREDGSGSYESSDGIAIGPDAGQGKPFLQAISVTQPLLANIFATARSQKFFAIRCEISKNEKIAFQGSKTLTYDGPDGKGSCIFNYSQNKQIQQIGEDLQSIASTIEAGHRLALQHQHDRLSLDAELGWLLQSVKDGHSIEIHNIRAILDEIAADPGVMNRARQRATLLASGKTR